MEYRFRPVKEEDHRALTDIFNYYIENSFAAYRENKIDTTFVEILRRVAGDHPIYTVESEEGEVTGFGMIHPYHPAETFTRVAELSYFLAPAHTGRGLGTILLNRLIEDARERGIDTLVASISSKNEQSINFHKKHGFVECGRFKCIGRKWGEDFDVIWMQKFI
ncbi:MAG: N-acetyltransferase [candidate division Zixibacteria bacterium]|nr:N-acetyltransferase [candidate division Zixibacteria bacterium]